MQKEIRWHYRFKNFSRAFALLREAAEMELSSDLEREGVVQRFEYTFELAWKLLADRLKHDGVIIPGITPRKVIHEAHAAKYIGDAEQWIDMLVDRNRMSHTYDSKVFESVIKSIRERHLSALDALYEQCAKEVNNP